METRKPPSLPRVLLVEDDTISQAYFRAVLEALPTAVDAVTTQACALARAETVRHDLWLVDLNLPDGSGPDLLQRLRARWPQPPPALAHTADADPAVRVAALQAGFRDVLVKPLATAELAGAVRSALADAGDLPDWDNAAAALALNHDPANVQALRRLFLEELPGRTTIALGSTPSPSSASHLRNVFSIGSMPRTSHSVGSPHAASPASIFSRLAAALPRLSASSSPARPARCFTHPSISSSEKPARTNVPARARQTLSRLPGERG